MSFVGERQSVSDQRPSIDHQLSKLLNFNGNYASNVVMPVTGNFNNGPSIAINCHNGDPQDTSWGNLEFGSQNGGLHPSPEGNLVDGYSITGNGIRDNISSHNDILPSINSFDSQDSDSKTMDIQESGEERPNYMCNSCLTPAVAVGFCVNCHHQSGRGMLCENCLSAHRFMHTLRGHKVNPLIPSNRFQIPSQNHDEEEEEEDGTDATLQSLHSVPYSMVGSPTYPPTGRIAKEPHHSSALCRSLMHTLLKVSKSIYAYVKYQSEQYQPGNYHQAECTKLTEAGDLVETCRDITEQLWSCVVNGMRTGTHFNELDRSIYSNGTGSNGLDNRCLNNAVHCYRQTTYKNGTQQSLHPSDYWNGAIDELLRLINEEFSITHQAPKIAISTDGSVFLNDERTNFFVQGNLTRPGLHGSARSCRNRVGPPSPDPMQPGRASELHSSLTAEPATDMPSDIRSQRQDIALQSVNEYQAARAMLHSTPPPPPHPPHPHHRHHPTRFNISYDRWYPGGGNLNPPVRINNRMTPLNIRKKFGVLGQCEGQFNAPHGFCLGMDNTIVVADTNNHRIQIFNENGDFKCQFGIPGRDEGQLWHPRKVAVFPHNGHFVICDRGCERSRMQIFSTTGHFMRKVAIRYIDIVAGLAISSNGKIVLVDSVVPTLFVLSEPGELEQWFDCSDYMREPSDLVINNGQYFICDFKGHCVVVLQEDGMFIRRIGGENITNFPNGIDFDENGNMLVGDSHGNRFHVAIFNRSGSLLSELECPFVKVSRCCGLRITRYSNIMTLAKNNHQVLILDPTVPLSANTAITHLPYPPFEKNPSYTAPNSTLSAIDSIIPDTGSHITKMTTAHNTTNRINNNNNKCDRQHFSCTSDNIDFTVADDNSPH